MYLNLVACSHIPILGYSVGDDDGLEVAVVDAVERLPGEYPVGQDGVYLLRSVVYQLLSSLE